MLTHCQKIMKKKNELGLQGREIGFIVCAQLNGNVPEIKY